MTPVTQSTTKPASIESGRILDVDVSTYTVSVTTEFTKKPVTGIKFATPYQHFANGEGIYFMPEVGSVCWVCFPSDHNRPFVIAWGPATSEGDARSKKKDLNPGDIYLGTRDENFLILRRGGVVQIGGGPLCQRVFIPINNTIKDFCENYGLHTIGGDLEWSVKRAETDTTGKRPSTLSVLAREFADDPNPVAELKIGSHDNDPKHILSLKIKKDGQKGAATQIELIAKSDGTLEWNLKKDVIWTVDENFKVTTKKGVAFDATDDFAVTAKKKVTMKGDSSVEIESGGDVTIKASGKVKIDPKVEAGGTDAVAMAQPLMTWLLAHTHIGSAPFAPTGPPLKPPGSDIKSTSLFAK